MFESLFTLESLFALISLTMIEIILGIDNVIFISILVDRVEKDKKEMTRKLGIFFALFTRLLLLFFISFIMGLNKPLFIIFDQSISGRDLTLILGGLFLFIKSIDEIHNFIEDKISDDITMKTKQYSNVWLVVLQIAFIDIIFSIDSVITAIGLANHIEIMVVSIVIAVFFMLFFSKVISDVINQYPSLKMLALAFLFVVGVVLIADGLDYHIPKGYVYFSLFFSFFVELLNIKLRKKN